MALEAAETSTQSQKDVVVFDLDGTLANIDHRVPLVNRADPDWDAFFKACVDDSPNQWCVELIECLRPFYDVRIVSARSKAVEKETREWLADLFGGDLLGIDLELLREAGDHSSDVDLKREWLKKFGKDRILFVVDDRQRIVDMWREEGLTCLQCYAWQEFKRPKAKDL